ncbi:hypothetical protein GCM10010172_87370 [Paractinoplanes ferrugineus]|uniref:Uncharacterized protein n=1 Tax=Paractinoplanes ferrugineus TaxID=113564 RepID=A0A919JAX3_9ACTN|nr:hypothetical protein Afe05nite_83520 [Actinoplanes ferrugineus]
MGRLCPGGADRLRAFRCASVGSAADPYPVSSRGRRGAPAVGIPGGGDTAGGERVAVRLDLILAVSGDGRRE